MNEYRVLDRIAGPADIKHLSDQDLTACQRCAEKLSLLFQTGGHLGSSLGVVELTVARMRFQHAAGQNHLGCGHQCYPHKILTELRAHSLYAKRDGLSRFTKRLVANLTPLARPIAPPPFRLPRI